MPKIIINEADYTNPVVSNDITDIPYIPGFSINNPGESTYTLNEPQLFASVTDFEEKIGRTPYYFADESGKLVSYRLDLEFDIAYVYAHELLTMGLPVYYEVIGLDTETKCTSVEQFYTALPNALDKYKDIGSYYLKYLTTGGYPILVDTSTTELIQKIAGVAATRGDAIALIDHVDGMPIVAEESGSPYAIINGLADSVFQIEGDADHKDTGSYAALTTPWQFYTFTTAYDANHENFKLKLAGSFAYLISLAQSIKNNPNCLAIAGVQRAVVPFTNAETSQSPKITNAIANSYCSGTKYGDNKRSINGITNIRGNGLTIWGNRTLLKNPVDRAVGAFGYLNIRNMVCDVKKVVYSACQELMFEQNNDILWINFKTKVTPLLDRLSTNGGIAGYKIVKQKCKNMAKLLATIILYPIYAVEEFEIGIEMRQEGISVVEQ